MDPVLELFKENPDVFLTEEQILSVTGLKDLDKKLQELVRSGKLVKIETNKKSGRKIYYGLKQN
ncbi:MULTISPECIES: hypothetical protein [unclassified Thermoplasma]|mgnify:CR=1 FL=1|uniref:hypothetical protein n=1 Tax=unclassified Thermoplasma TaxID=2684908 RepID=UPI000D9DAA53|nr:MULTISPECIES: hypothetical protein [unclassified Thermoplasma]PYB69081.1 hypothetical protein DMB44_00550 [Thermoplasma sp. Kam2015]